MSQSVGHSALDFGSRHEIEPFIRLCAHRGVCLGFSLFPSALPSACELSFSKKKKKEKNIEGFKELFCLYGHV